MAFIRDQISNFYLKIDAFQAAYNRLRGKNGNDLALTAGEKIANNQEFLNIGGINDSFTLPIRVDRLGNILTGNGIREFSELSDASSINSLRWNGTTSGFAQVFNTQGVNLTFTSVTSSGSSSVLVSQAFFEKSPRVPLQIKCRAQVNAPQNTIIEIGFGSPTSANVLTQGAVWRITGNIATPWLVNASGGLEVAGVGVDISAHTSGSLVFDVILDDDGGIFFIHETETDTLISRQTVQVPKAWVKMFQAARVQAFARVFNQAIASASPSFRFSEFIVIAHDLFQNRPFTFQQAINRMGGSVHPQNGSTTTNGTNSASPASATLSNSTASYTTLDGEFQFAAVAGVETDYCLFGYTVPTGYRLAVFGTTIDVWNSGAAVATTPTTMVWGIGENGTSANLSTGAHLRHRIGVNSFPIGAAIGQDAAKQINAKYDAPLIIESGRNFATILKMPTATATPSQIIRGFVKHHAIFF